MAVHAFFKTNVFLARKTIFSHFIPHFSMRFFYNDLKKQTGHVIL